MDSVAAIPLLLLVTYRVGYTPPFGSLSFHTTLTLRSLSEAESLAMAGRVLGSEQFPEELHTAPWDTTRRRPDLGCHAISLARVCYARGQTRVMQFFCCRYAPSPLSLPSPALGGRGSKPSAARGKSRPE